MTSKQRLLEEAKQTRDYWLGEIDDAGPDFQTMHMLLGVCVDEIERLRAALELIAGTNGTECAMPRVVASKALAGTAVEKSGWRRIDDWQREDVALYYSPEEGIQCFHTATDDPTDQIKEGLLTSGYTHWMPMPAPPCSAVETSAVRRCVLCDGPTGEHATCDTCVAAGKLL